MIPIQGGLYLVLFLKVLFLLELSSCRMNLGMMGCLHDGAVLQIRTQDMSVCVCVEHQGKLVEYFFFSVFECLLENCKVLQTAFT